jgi:hypothetical protein
VLGDHRSAVGGHLGDREAGVLEPGYLGEKREVAAGSLRPALDHVPGHDGAGQGVPVVALPAVMPRGRAQRQRRVGDPAGDDDVRAAGQGLGDAPPAQVRVRGEHRPLAERLTGVHVGEVRPGRAQLAQPRDQVVALDVGDDRVQAELARDSGDRLGAAVRGQPAGVRHHLDPPVQALPHDLFHLRDEGPRITGPVVPGQVLGQHEHGQLGQPVAGQHVDRPAFDHLPGGGQPVTVEPAAVGDAQRRGSHFPASLAGRRAGGAQASSAHGRAGGAQIGRAGGWSSPLGREAARTCGVRPGGCGSCG